MISLLSIVLAEYHPPLFGNQWISFGVILAGLVVLLAAVAALGRRRAITPPDVPPKPAVTPTAATAGPSNETLAIIAACVAVTFGDRARIASVRPGGSSLEMFRQQWSVEGRREIYSSHKIR